MNLTSLTWLILVPVIFAAAVYLVGRIVRNPAAWYLPCALAVTGLLAAWIPLTLAARQLLDGEVPEYQLGAVLLRMDPLSLILSITALGLGTLVALYSGAYLLKEAGQEKFYAM